MLVDGIIKFSPTNTLDKESINNPCWCILSIDKEFSNYYNYIYEKIKYNKLQSPKWGPHITIIRNEIINSGYLNNWKELDGEKITINYNNKLITNKKHYWFDVEKNIFYDIRKKMGIIVKPEYGFHLTFGVKI